MSSPIEDQLRDYFTMVDRMQEPVDTDALHDGPTPPSLRLIDDNHDNQDNHLQLEDIMLSPDRIHPPARSRTWMLVAAAVAALALVGGLLVIANRDADEQIPADQPEPVPSLAEPEAEVIVDPDGGDAADPEAVEVVAPEPEVVPAENADASDPAAVPDATPTNSEDAAAAESDALAVSGTNASECNTAAFRFDADRGALYAPLTCLAADVDELGPFAAQSRAEFSLYTDDPDAVPPITPFTTFSDDGALSAGITYGNSLNTRSVGVGPGSGDYEGVEIDSWGRFLAGEGGATDWFISDGLLPLQTSEDVELSAEVSFTCSSSFVESTGTTETYRSTCEYSGDDARFFPETSTMTLRFVEPEGGADQFGGTRFAIITAEDGTLRSGLIFEGGTAHYVGIRPGTGGFEGMLLHEIATLSPTNDLGSSEGTMRVSVLPAPAN